MEELLDEQLGTGDGLDIGRYLRAFIRRWWIILIIFLAISIPWLIHLQSQPPMYEAEVWISFENVTREAPERIIQGREMRLRSRTFAEDVTADLGLTLELIQQEDELQLTRQDVFTLFRTNKEPKPGVYTLRFYPNGTTAFYAGNRKIDSLKTETYIDSPVTHAGFTFQLKSDISWDRSMVKFRINNFRNTVESLQNREQIRTNKPGNLMRITLRDRNPVLAARTVNMLADMFVEKSLEMGKERSRLVSNYLKDQLAIVQRELTETDNAMKSFRNTHLMGLNETTRQTVERLDRIETRLRRLQANRDELSMLLSKLNPNSPEFDSSISATYIYRLISQHSVFNNSQEMTLTRQELSDLDESLEEMLETYPVTNPAVMEIQENIQILETKITELARAEIREIDSDVIEAEENLAEIQKSLDSMPEEELRQIQLTRQRRMNEEMHDLYMRRYKEALISEAVDSENISILDPAVVPDRPIDAGHSKKAIMGLFLALMLGVGCVFFLELTDRRIKTRDDVKRYLKLPILGAIPLVKFDEYELKDSEKAKSISSQIVTHDYSPTPVGEAYRALRTNLLFSKSIGPIRTLVIGSVSPGEGKSFTAANLAITLAQQKSKTLLIDADLRRGVLHNSFNCPKKPGLTNYLTGVVPLENVMNETYIPNLTLITCGSMIPNPSEVLGSIRMRRFIEGITKRFDFIIFDTPPLMAASDAVILGTLVDGTAIVIRSGRTNRDDIQKKLEVIQNVRARVFGAILNCAGVEVAHEGYSYYRY